MIEKEIKLDSTFPVLLTGVIMTINSQQYDFKPLACGTKIDNNDDITVYISLMANEKDIVFAVVVHDKNYHTKDLTELPMVDFKITRYNDITSSTTTAIAKINYIIKTTYERGE